MIESDYETCDSDRTPTTDEDEDDDTVRSKRTRRKWKSLSRTYSDVSLNTNKEEFQGKHRSIYSMKETSKENASLSIISEIFDGKIASEIEYLTCNRRSKTIETFQDLTLQCHPKNKSPNFIHFNQLKKSSISLIMIQHSNKTAINHDRCGCIPF